MGGESGGGIVEAFEEALGMETDDEDIQEELPAEDLGERQDPEEALDPLRRCVRPLPTPEEQRLHRVTHCEGRLHLGTCWTL